MSATTIHNLLDLDSDFKTKLDLTKLSHPKVAALMVWDSRKRSALTGIVVHLSSQLKQQRSSKQARLEVLLLDEVGAYICVDLVV